jgi:hypothetical protein
MNRSVGPRRPRARAIACGVVGLALTTMLPVAAHAASARDPVRALGDAYLARIVERSPEQATALGFHDHDDRLVPVTQATLADDRAWYHELRSRLEAVPAAGLSPALALERELLIARVDARLADLEVTRPFETDPAAYLPLIAESVHAILERNVGSVCGRAHLAARRLWQVPEVLRAARINLRDAPAERITIALDRLEGVLRFYRQDVPAMASDCRDGRSQADLAEADSGAVHALEAFMADLRAQAAAPARARATLAIGPEACRRWVEAALMESVSLDSLRAEAGRAVDQGRRRVDSLAAVVHPDPPVHFDRWRVEYAVRRIGTFVVQHELVTVKPAIGATVIEAPAYAAEPLTADVPGPWEERPRSIRLERVRRSRRATPSCWRCARRFPARSAATWRSSRCRTGSCGCWRGSGRGARGRGSSSGSSSRPATATAIRGCGSPPRVPRCDTTAARSRHSASIRGR